jgi:four helix bundle protein
MSKYTKFEDLPVWREAARLYGCVLDLMEAPGGTLTAGLRNQLERAALSVANDIADGFERVTNQDRLASLDAARSSAVEVRFIVAVLGDRPKLKPHLNQLQEIRSLAESCVRQLAAWTHSIEGSNVQGKRPSAAMEGQPRETEGKAQTPGRTASFGDNRARSPYGSAGSRPVRGEPNASQGN